MILGIDEVGRGAWAGPLVVGAVILGEAKIDGLTDSKMLTKKRREGYDRAIREKTSAIGLGWVSANEIDRIGLGEALRVATKRAVQQVQLEKVSFHEVIIDGTVNFLSSTALAKYAVTMKKADLLIASVSAASIVAKVARDEYMEEQAKVYPEYGFSSHVGYGTAGHRRAIEENGITPLHRLSIAPLAKYRTNDYKVHVKESTTKTTRDIGNASETVACEYLQRHGYEIIERNWKTKWCEIDIVAKKDKTYYFVEVKHRKNSDTGSGMDAITSKKQRQMRLASEIYVVRKAIRHADVNLLTIATTGHPPFVQDFVLLT